MVDPISILNSFNSFQKFVGRLATVNIRLQKNTRTRNIKLVTLLESLSPSELIKHEKKLFRLIAESYYQPHQHLAARVSKKYKKEIDKKYVMDFFEKEFSQEQSSAANFAKGNIYLLGLFKQRKDIAKAIDCFSRVGKSAPVLYIEAQYQLANCYQARKDYLQAGMAFENLIDAGEKYLKIKADANNKNEIEELVEHAQFTMEMMAETNEKINEKTSDKSKTVNATVLQKLGKKKSSFELEPELESEPEPESHKIINSSAMSTENKSHKTSNKTETENILATPQKTSASPSQANIKKAEKLIATRTRYTLWHHPENNNEALAGNNNAPTNTHDSVLSSDNTLPPVA